LLLLYHHRHETLNKTNAWEKNQQGILLHSVFIVFFITIALKQQQNWNKFHPIRKKISTCLIFSSLPRHCLISN
jgi:hypothetical protein